ncbi:MAG: hypothetical protein MRY49_00595 [Candidatus Pacebacteria bacterium]|nr:hypothetical protein [Candidatus Paceibacterota bacterium]
MSNQNNSLPNDPFFRGLLEKYGDELDFDLDETNFPETHPKHDDPEWEKQLRNMHRQIREAERVTAEDLGMTINY